MQHFLTSLHIDRNIQLMLRFILGLSLLFHISSIARPFYQKCAMSPVSTRPSWSSNAYNHNPQWTAVDAYALKNLHPATRPNGQALENTLKASDAGGLPDYNLSSAQAKFLALHCRTAGFTPSLEVGTLGGYSAIWLASENPQLHLTTIEYRRKHYEVARKNIELTGLSDRIEVIHGTGIEVLTSLSKEVEAGKRPKFGFVFIDADKDNNWNYFKLSKSMVKFWYSVSRATLKRYAKLRELTQLGNYS
jgi:predicted O-methyltransferase YrrM